MRFSGLRILKEGLTGNKGWGPHWRDPDPKPEYDIIIIGGGGHGLATAFYLAKEHGLTNVAVLEKGYLGGGNVGLRVAQTLEGAQTRMRAKVIERNRACAENAADILERTVVLHGDGLDMDLMEEANLQSSDALLAVTDDDKTNLLACARDI